MGLFKTLLIFALYTASVGWAQSPRPADLNSLIQAHKDNEAAFMINYEGQRFRSVMRIKAIKQSEYSPRSSPAFHVYLENENKKRVGCYIRKSKEIENISLFKLNQKIVVSGLIKRVFQPDLLSLDNCNFSDARYDLEQYCRSSKLYEAGVLMSCIGVTNFRACNGFHCDEVGKTTGFFQRKDFRSELSLGRVYVTENKDGTSFDIVIDSGSMDNERYVISYYNGKKDYGDEYFQFFKERVAVVNGFSEGYIVGTIVASVKKRKNWGSFKYGVPCREKTNSMSDFGHISIDLAYGNSEAPLPVKYHSEMSSFIVNAFEIFHGRRTLDAKISGKAFILAEQAENVMRQLLNDPEFVLSVRNLQEKDDSCGYRQQLNKSDF